MRGEPEPKVGDHWKARGYSTMSGTQHGRVIVIQRFGTNHRNEPVAIGEVVARARYVSRWGKEWQEGPRNGSPVTISVAQLRKRYRLDRAHA